MVDASAQPTGASAEVAPVPENLETPEVAAEGAAPVSDEGFTEEPKKDPNTAEPREATATENAEIQKFMTMLKLPKGVDYFMRGDEVRFIVPINGQKFEVTPEGLVKGFGLQQAGYQKLNEAKQIQKDIADYFSGIKQNPKTLWDLADRLGVDKEDLARSFLEERVKEYSMTPEERELRKRAEEAERYKQEVEQYKTKEEQAKFMAEKQEAAQRYDRELTEAMTKHGFAMDHVTKQVRTQVLENAIRKMVFAFENGHELSADDAVKLAKQDGESFWQATAGSLTPKEVLKWLSPAHKKAVIEEYLAEAKAGNPIGDVIPTSNLVDHQPLTGQEVSLKEISNAKSNKKRRETISDFFANLR
jgi:hypothetical protein